MASKSSPKLIGGFVVGAIALIVVALLAFGGSKFLEPKEVGVLFFDGSMAGLDVGSPVTFRGVKIGQVTSVVIQYDVVRQVLHIPVIIEVQPEKVEITSGERRPGQNLRALVERGLRGQLVVQSLVTGQVSVDFDFHPEVPIRLVGAKPGMLELPTMPSDIDVLKANVVGVLNKISKLPTDELSADLIAVLKGAEQTLETVQGTFKNLDTQIQPLADSAKGAADQANRLLANTDTDLPKLVANLQQVLTTANSALGQADQTLRTAHNSISPNSPLYVRLDAALRELDGAAQSIHALAETLQRNPQAVLTGKK
jgi:paraquat-inducible protein B